MSLIYDDESDIAEKDEEINMEKIEPVAKERATSKRKARKSKRSEEYEDTLDNEALMNIPTKSISVKNKRHHKNSKNILKDKDKDKDKEKEKEKEIYDTSYEGVEIPIINNNINNGSLMLTELLDLDNNNSEGNKSKSKITLNIDEKEKEEKNNSFLQKKLENAKIPQSLKKGINSGIKKTHDEIHDELKNDILNISKRNASINELLTLNKSHSNVFLTRVERISKENRKRLKNLKIEEQYLKKNIAKLEQNKKIIENGMPLKSNVVDINIRKTQLKNMSTIKEELVAKLLKINEKIDILLNEEKMRKKGKVKLYYDNLEDEQEQYNLHLVKLQKEQNLQRTKFSDDLKLAFEKKQKNCEKKEKELLDKKNKFLKNIKDKDREMILKRKKDADEKLEKTKRHINDKYSKKISEYLFYKYKQKYENNEKKLIDKVNMIKKDSLVTKKEILDLAKKIKMQKKLLLEDAEDKKKQLLKLWSYRSQTLPVYKHPLTIKIEKEHAIKIEREEEEKKKKECNELEKRNYKPPKVIISQKLKSQREIRKDKIDKESVLRTELNNKKRLDKYKFTPINSPKHLKIIHELSQELNNNNYIDYNEVKSMINKKNKKKLKPIQILHPKPEKPIDYLTEMITKKNKIKNNDEKDKEKEKNNDNMNNLFNINKEKEKGGNIIESLKMAKATTEAIDSKVQQKKQILKLNGGYLNNPQLGDEVGDLLIESIQTKLGIMNRLNGE